MTNRSAKNHAAAAFAWLMYLLLALWLSVVLAWKLCAAVGYGYSFWYEQLDIRAHISQYAPQHPYKRGFSQLPPEQHRQAFAQIAEAVHRGGRGLDAITYPGPDGQPVPLLDSQEKGHLQDVARLLGAIELISLVLVPLWGVLAWCLVRLELPGTRSRWLAGLALALLITLPLLLAGPKAVFYQLHEWLFPPDHPWFFYWNESLMSTLMKAPDLFGGIAVMIAVMAAPLWWGLYRTGLRLASRTLA